MWVDGEEITTRRDELGDYYPLKYTTDFETPRFQIQNMAKLQHKNHVFGDTILQVPLNTGDDCGHHPKTCRASTEQDLRN